MTGRSPQNGSHRLAVAVAALVLALTTGACVTYTGARYGGPDAPLQARLASAHGGQPSLHFAVSDRAHVALFRIHDSGHVRALYPYHPGSSSIFRPGAHTVLSSAGSYGGSWSPFSRFATGFGSRSPYSSARGFGQVRTSYLMMVASREPLRMSRIRNDVPFRFRRISSLLTTPFYGRSAFGAMDLLLDRLIPEGLPRDDWDVDWVVATDFGAPGYRHLRVPLLRRIAMGTGPPAQDTTSHDTRRRRLDTGDLPFNPPKIPVDLPEVSVDSSEGSTRVRVPLPPVAVTPVPRALPEGNRRKPAVEPDAVEPDAPERRPREAGPRSLPGPSDHFARLFDGDDRGERRPGEGWVAWSDESGRAADRAIRNWAREMNEWANEPDRHDFPDPPRPPSRWRGRDGADWASDGFNPRNRLTDPRNRGRDVGHIDPPNRPPRGGDIEGRRPSRSDAGDRNGSRKSGGGSSDDRGGG